MAKGSTKSKKSKSRKPVDYSNLAALWDQFLNMYDTRNWAGNTPGTNMYDTRNWAGNLPTNVGAASRYQPRGVFGQIPGAFDYSQYDRWGNRITNPTPGPEVGPGGGLYEGGMPIDTIQSVYGTRYLPEYAIGPLPERVSGTATNYMAPLQPGSYRPTTTAQSIADWYKARNDLTPGVPGVGVGGGTRNDLSWAKLESNPDRWSKLAWETFSELNKDRYEKSGGTDAGAYNRFNQPIGFAPPPGSSAGSKQRRGGRRYKKKAELANYGYTGPGSPVSKADAWAARNRRKAYEGKWGASIKLAIDRKRQRSRPPGGVVTPTSTAAAPTGYAYTPPNEPINWRI